MSSSYQLFRKERLATAELECQKLIQEATTQLTQVCQLVQAPLGWTCAEGRVLTSWHDCCWSRGLCLQLAFCVPCHHIPTCVLQLARQPGTTLQALQQAHAQLQAKYDGAPGAAGPEKARRWHHFNAQIFNALLQDVHDRSQRASEQQLAKAQQQFSQVTQQAQQVGLQLLQTLLVCKGLLLRKKLMARPCAAGAGQGADAGGAAQQPVPPACEALPARLLLCLPDLIGQALCRSRRRLLRSSRWSSA